MPVDLAKLDVAAILRDMPDVPMLSDEAEPRKRGRPRVLSEDAVTFTLSVDPEPLARFDARAKREEKSRAQLLRELIEMHGD